MGRSHLIPEKIGKKIDLDLLPARSNRSLWLSVVLPCWTVREGFFFGVRRVDKEEQKSDRPERVFRKLVPGKHIGKSLFLLGNWIAGFRGKVDGN